MTKIKKDNSYHHIYILGGHKLALSYYKPLKKAKSEGNLQFQKLYCVTSDPKAPVLNQLPHEDIIFKTPSDFILEKTLFNPSVHPQDVLVPDHTAKHVFLQVFMDLVQKKFPNTSKLCPFEHDFSPPFLHKGDQGAIWAMSYATWQCPPDCDEPATCPHIQAPRSWDFTKIFAQLFKNDSKKDHIIYTFRCQPLYQHISQIPFTSIANSLQAYQTQLIQNNPLQILVITHSHCHAILGKFRVKKS